jgi:hypothetical protein
MPKESPVEKHRICPQYSYLHGQYEEAVKQHRRHPVEERLLVVADIARCAVNVCAPLIRKSNPEGARLFDELYAEGRDYCRQFGFNYTDPGLSKDPTPELILDRLDELQREVREIRDALGLVHLCIVCKSARTKHPHQPCDVCRAKIHARKGAA